MSFNRNSHIFLVVVHSLFILILIHDRSYEDPSTTHIVIITVQCMTYWVINTPHYTQLCYYSGLIYSLYWIRKYFIRSYQNRYSMMTQLFGSISLFYFVFMQEACDYTGICISYVVRFKYEIVFALYSFPYTVCTLCLPLS